MRELLSGGRGDRAELRDATTVAGALRERIYATLTGVATLMLLVIHVEDETVTSSVVSVVIAMTTLWLASLVSEFIAHAATHDTAGDQRSNVRRILFTAGQSLELILFPVVLILLSRTGIWSLRTALILAVSALMATLAIASIYAVRRSSFGSVARGVIVLVELGLGAAVILAKVLAH